MGLQCVLECLPQPSPNCPWGRERARSYARYVSVNIGVQESVPVAFSLSLRRIRFPVKFGMGSRVSERGRCRMANDEHVVRFLGGDVNPDARQWRYDAADVVATEDTTLGPWFRISRSMWSASSVSGGNSRSRSNSNADDGASVRTCSRRPATTSTSYCSFSPIHPFSCVSFSLRDDDYGRDPSSSAVPYSTALTSGFRKLRSINGTTNVIRSVSTPLAITPRGGYGTPRKTHTEGRGRMRYELSVSRARTVSTGAGAVRRTRSVMLPSNSRSESLRPCVPMTQQIDIFGFRVGGDFNGDCSDGNCRADVDPVDGYSPSAAASRSHFAFSSRRSTSASVSESVP